MTFLRIMLLSFFVGFFFVPACVKAPAASGPEPAAPAPEAAAQDDSAMPVADTPPKEALPPVQGLKAQAVQEEIHLSWTVGRTEGGEVDRYVIYRCQDGSMGKPCRDYPSHFQCVAVVPAKELDPVSGKGAYADHPPQNGVFYYKIKAVDKEGRAGGDSEFATVRFKGGN